MKTRRNFAPAEARDLHLRVPRPRAGPAAVLGTGPRPERLQGCLNGPRGVGGGVERKQRIAPLLDPASRG